MVFLTKWTIRKVLQIRGISPHFIFGEKGVMDQFGTVVFVGVHKDFANVNGGKKVSPFCANFIFKHLNLFDGGFPT